MENTKQSTMEELLISYESGLDSAQSEIEKLLGRELTGEDNETLSEFVSDWENSPCDDEGPSHEQDELLDRILEKYAKKLLK